MTIEQQIRPSAIKIPHAEITHMSRGYEAKVDHFEGMWGAKRGDAINALLNVAVCRQINIHNLELYKIVESIGQSLAGSDSVIIMHGPFAERVGGIPEIGHDGQHGSWHGTEENDVELTILSKQQTNIIKRALEYGQNSLVGITRQNGSDWYYKFSRSGWRAPSWNMNGTEPTINDFFTTHYSYFRKKYPAIDFHYVNGKDPVSEFITIYGNRYSNIFGQRFLACFINPDGSLDQRVWQPVKPERAPKDHNIKLIDRSIFKMPWWISEAVKMAIDAQRYSTITKTEATIDPLMIDEAKNALHIQSNVVRREKGQEWLEQKARKKLETAYHRSTLFDNKGGRAKINRELQRVGWFDAVGIRP